MPRRSSRLEREIRAIRMSFSQLARSFGRMAPLLGEHADVRIVQLRGKRRRKLRLTAARRTALRIQGRYMGALRGLTPSQRSRVKKIRAAKGIAAALSAARRMAG